VFRALCIALSLSLAPALATAQGAGDARSNWHLLARATVSGSAEAQTEEEYTVYSGLALEAAVARRLGELFALELSVRTESREVDGPAVDGTPRLGSLQVFPANLTLQWRPRAGGEAVFQPYAGAGLNLTAVWEKSGALDSTDSPANLGPVGQLGSVFRLSSGMVLSVDIKWNPLDIEIEGLADPVPKIEVDPLTLGIGLGFVF